jgi:hypothetical protein
MNIARIHHNVKHQIPSPRTHSSNNNNDNKSNTAIVEPLTPRCTTCLEGRHAGQGAAKDASRQN